MIYVGSNVAAEYALFLVRVLSGVSRNGPAILVHALSDAQYRKGSSGGAAARIWLRLRMYCEYPLRLLWAMLCAPKGSVFIVTSNTFFTPWLAGFFGWIRKQRVVHLLYDLYPEALLVARGTPLPSPSQPLRLGVLEHAITLLMRSTFKRAEATVFIGERLKSYAEARYGATQNAAVIPVGSDASLFSSQPPDELPEGNWTILYSGQLGHMHDWQTLLEAWRRDMCPGYRFLLRGGGAGMRALTEAVKAASPLRAEVQLGGSQATGSWVETLEAAPIGLITLRPGAEAVVFPSKTFSALMAGQAILAIAPEASDLADLVNRHQCGWVIAPGDTASLLNLLRRLRANPAEVLQARRNAWHAGREHFAAGALEALWRPVVEPRV